MDMILLVAAALLVVGISLAFNLTATQIADDVMNMIRPTDKLRTKVDNVQENKRKTGMYAKLRKTMGLFVRKAKATATHHAIQLLVTDESSR